MHLKPIQILVLWSYKLHYKNVTMLPPEERTTDQSVTQIIKTIIKKY